MPKLKHWNGSSWVPLSAGPEGEWDVRDSGAIGNGITNDTASIAAAMQRARVVRFPSGYTFLTNSRVVIPPGVKVIIEAGAVVKNTTTGNNGIFEITAGSSDIEIIGGGQLIGPYDATTPAPMGVYPNSNGAIRITGTNASPCRNIKLEGVHIRGWGDYGVFAENVRDSSFSHNLIEKCGRDGIRFYGAQDTKVNYNRIDNIAPGIAGVAPNLNVYGVTFTRNPTAGHATHPRSERCQAIGNIVTNCLTWKGLDTHGGKDITFALNTVKGAYIAIGVDEGDTTANPDDSPPEGIKIIDNTLILDAGNANGAAINVAANSFTNPAKDITIKNNRVVGGFGGPTLGGAVTINYSRGVLIEGNYIENASRCGIVFRTQCEGVRVRGNHIRDLTGTVVAAIASEAAAVDLDIESGTFSRSTGTYTAFSFASPSAGYTVSLGDQLKFFGTITKFAASARGRVAEGGFMQSAKAWGRVTGAGVKSGTCYGIDTVTKTATGIYRITLKEAQVSTANVVVLVTIDSNVAASATALVVDTQTIDVYTFAGAVAADLSFRIGVLGS